MRHALVSAAGGLLAVGLGIGAALAATPGVASADPSTDPFSWIGGMDLGDLSVPAQALDIQVSIDGFDLLPTAGNTATANSGMGDIAIAIGNGAEANAGAGSAFGEGLTPGLFDSAVAIGTNSFASAGQGNLDSAFADGTNSLAGVGGFDGILSNGDFGAAFGPNTDAEAGVFNDVPSQNDVALIFDPSATVGSTAHAGDGNFDLASVFGADSTALAGLPGNFDLGAVFGDGFSSTAATGGNFLLDILTPFGTL
jgi:hypothetical protein